MRNNMKELLLRIAKVLEHHNTCEIRLYVGGKCNCGLTEIREIAEKVKKEGEVK